MNKTMKLSVTQYRKNKAVKKKSRTKGGKVWCVKLFVALFVFLSLPVNVYAVNGATIGLTNLANLLSTIVKIAGGIFAIFSFSILGPGLSQHDGSQIRMGLLSLAGALIMIFHMEILGVMGISI